MSAFDNRPGETNPMHASLLMALSLLVQGGPAGPLELIATQAEAWNRGDLDAFMAPYWKDDRLSFSAGGRTLRGWQATLDNYRRRYPTREAMGQLRFNQLELQPLGDEAALVLGRWRVQPAGDGEPREGNFSLVFRRIDGRWVIVHDHTSVGDEP